MAKHKQGKRFRRKHNSEIITPPRNKPIQTGCDNEIAHPTEDLLKQHPITVKWRVLTSEFEEVRSGKLLSMAPTKTYAFDNPHRHLGTSGCKKGEIWMCLPIIVDAVYIRYLDETASARGAVIPYVDYNYMKRVISSTLGDAPSSTAFNCDLTSHQERCLKPLLSKLRFFDLKDEERRPLWQEIQSLNLSILRETPKVPRRNAKYGHVSGFPL